MTDDNNNQNALMTTIVKYKKIKLKKLKQVHRLFVSSMKIEDKTLQITRHFWVMGIDAYGYVDCIYNVLYGLPDIKRGVVTPFDILQTAITRRCIKIIIAYNREAGLSLEPNKTEKEFTNWIYHFARHAHSIKLLDSLILNFNEYFSYYKKGYLHTIKRDTGNQTCIEAKNILNRRMKKLENKTRIETIEERNIELAKEMLLDNMYINTVLKYTNLRLKDIEDIKKELDKIIDLAKKMLADNVDINKISKDTELTIEYIEDIKKDMGL